MGRGGVGLRWGEVAVRCGWGERRYPVAGAAGREVALTGTPTTLCSNCSTLLGSLLPWADELVLPKSTRLEECATRARSKSESARTCTIDSIDLRNLRWMGFATPKTVRPFSLD